MSGLLSLDTTLRKGAIGEIHVLVFCRGLTINLMAAYPSTQLFVLGKFEHLSVVGKANIIFLFRERKILISMTQIILKITDTPYISLPPNTLI